MPVLLLFVGEVRHLGQQNPPILRSGQKQEVDQVQMHYLHTIQPVYSALPHRCIPVCLSVFHALCKTRRLLAIIPNSTAWPATIPRVHKHPKRFDSSFGNQYDRTAARRLEASRWNNTRFLAQQFRWKYRGYSSGWVCGFKSNANVVANGLDSFVKEIVVAERANPWAIPHWFL